MDKDLFDDLVTSCKEAIEHKKGNIQLRTHTVEISDEVLEKKQLFWHKMEALPQSEWIKVETYVDELLRA